MSGDSKTLGASWGAFPGQGGLKIFSIEIQGQYYFLLLKILFVIRNAIQTNMAVIAEITN